MKIVSMWLHTLIALGVRCIGPNGIKLKNFTKTQKKGNNLICGKFVLK